jgi:hypothetical protein
VVFAGFGSGEAGSGAVDVVVVAVVVVVVVVEGGGVVPSASVGDALIAAPTATRQRSVRRLAIM